MPKVQRTTGPRLLCDRPQTAGLEPTTSRSLVERAKTTRLSRHPSRLSRRNTSLGGNSKSKDNAVILTQLLREFSRIILLNAEQR